jgi:hypothetical protein
MRIPCQILKYLSALFLNDIYSNPRALRVKMPLYEVMLEEIAGPAYYSLSFEIPCCGDHFINSFEDS